MTIKSMVMAGILGMALTSTVSAENYKLHTCTIAETAFWNAYKKAYDFSEHSFVDSLQESDKIAYFNLHKGELQQTMQAVETQCSSIDKVVASQYSKKMAEMQKELDKL